MKIIKPKILVVLGATATGKSELAVKLALKYNGEIISADSRQVYKGMDIGTAKITKKEMLGIPHHMLDIVGPNTTYNVSKYKVKAEKIIRDILKRGKLPIICGGTGFYIDALVNNTSLPNVLPNIELRKKLEKKSCEELIKILKKYDHKKEKNIDKKNKRRIIRAIEIAQAVGKMPKLTYEPLYTSLQIGLTLPDKILKERIFLRLEKRMNGGMLNEVRKLRRQGVSWKRLEALGLEYRYLARYLRGQLGREQMLEQLNTKTWQFVKRQRTWFKRDQNIIWINTQQKKEISKIDKIITNFLRALHVEVS